MLFEGDPSTILQILTTAAIVVGVIFGLAQLRQATQRRRDHDARGQRMRENRNPNVGEWWQWLYELLEADPDPSKERGAYVEYRRRSRG